MKHSNFQWLACLFAGLVFAAISDVVTLLLMGYKLSASSLFWVFYVLYFLIYYQASYIMARWRDDKLDRIKMQKAERKEKKRLRDENKTLRSLINNNESDRGAL